MAGQLYRLRKMIVQWRPPYVLLWGAIIFMLLGGVTTFPLPFSLAVITPENVDEIQQIGFLGRGIISDMAWSPDGSVLALGSLQSGIIWFYNPHDLNVEPRWLNGNHGGVTQLTFSGDGKILASVGLDNMVHIWDMPTGSERAQYRKIGVNSAALSQDGKLLILGSGASQNAWIMDTATGTQIARLKGHEQRVYSVAFSPDSKLAITGSEDGTVRVWDVASGTQLAKLEGHNGAVNSVAFNPDSGMFASGGSDGTVRLWDWNGAAGTIGIVRRGHTNTVDNLAFRPDGRVLASAGFDNNIRLWNMDTSTQQAILTGHTDRVRGIAFSPDGKTLASISNDQTLRMWDVATDTEVNRVKILRGHYGFFGATDAVFSPDGTTIASGGDEGSVILWDVATGEERAVLNGHTRNTFCVVYSPDGKTLASAGNDGQVILWDLATETSRILDSGFTPSMCVAFSPDGKTLAGTNESTHVWVWDVATGERRAFDGHTGNGWGVAFSPDGKTLASSNTDSTIRLWDLETGNLQAILQGDPPAGLFFPTFSRDGTLLAAGEINGKHNIHLWDVATRTERPLLQGHEEWSFGAFSPDGRLLFSGSGNVTTNPQEASLRVWDVQTSTQLRILARFSATLNTIRFNSEGTMFASTLMDGTIRLWGVPTSN